MKFHIFDKEQELIMAFADYFIEKAQKYISDKGLFNVVLAGGSSPKKVYELLASPGFRDKIDWGKVNFFFGDERYVPANDSQNNALMVEKTLFSPLQISKAQIFKVDTSLPPKESAEKYMQTITAHFKRKPIHFDLILLGLGDNAHTASLFPFTDVLYEKMPSVKAVYLKEDGVFRITMTAPLINQAKHIAYLVFGENKAEAVLQVIKGDDNPEQFPAQLISPENGDMHWFLDKKAARFLV